MSAVLPLVVALVVQGPTAMRAAPGRRAPQQATLWQGDWLEVRGQRKDYLQVYDHRRERPGYVHVARVRRYTLDAASAPRLRAVIDFLLDTPGAESLGIGYVALYLRAAPATGLDSSVFAALGRFAARMARRASSASGGRGGQRALAAQLDVAASYGVKFRSVQRDDRARLCYAGDAFARVLVDPRADVDEQARAALALSEPACADPLLPPERMQALRAAQLETIERVDPARCVPYLGNRLRLRRASLAAQLSYAAARRGAMAEAARLSRGAYAALLRVDRANLADPQQGSYQRTALRVAALRWARDAAPSRRRAALQLRLSTNPSGQTCVALHDGRARRAASAPLLTRCTYGLVWPSSVRISPRSRQLTVAVQQLPGWLETWVFRRDRGQWRADTLVPAPVTPRLGYVEVAGWTPGGRSLLVVREAQGAGGLVRRFQSLACGTLAPRVTKRSLARFASFRRWRAPDWQAGTLALRR